MYLGQLRPRIRFIFVFLNVLHVLLDKSSRWCWGPLSQGPFGPSAAFFPSIPCLLCFSEVLVFVLTFLQ